MEKFLMGFVAFLFVKVCDGLRAFTPDNEDYVFLLARKGLTVTNTTQLKFKLKACNDGYIFLQEDEVSDLFRIGNWAFAIGVYSNSRCEIFAAPRNAGGARYSSHNEAVLDCNEFRPFWIRWKGGLLELGKGSEFGIDRISFHTITPVEFNYVFLMTGWGSDGCWDIDIASTVLTSGWKKVPGNKKLQGTTLTGHQARSLIECTFQCARPTEELPCGCVEYSYNKITKQCLVVDESETSTIVTSTDWETWQLM